MCLVSFVLSASQPPCCEYFVHPHEKVRWLLSQQERNFVIIIIIIKIIIKKQKRKEKTEGVGAGPLPAEFESKCSEGPVAVSPPQPVAPDASFPTPRGRPLASVVGDGEAAEDGQATAGV